ncbi:MAG: hypothetical protein Q8891_00975 [Bacteroidota bacterium]|nr:hypothetical protein [Bacteroidota bacterium]
MTHDQLNKKLFNFSLSLAETIDEQIKTMTYLTPEHLWLFGRDNIFFNKTEFPYVRNIVRYESLNDPIKSASCDDTGRQLKKIIVKHPPNRLDRGRNAPKNKRN